MNLSVSRVVAAVIAVLVVAPLLALAQPASAQEESGQGAFDNVERLDVGSFVDAGLAVSLGGFEPGSTTAVVLVTAENFPDALTASAVASRVGGPVLFTAGDVLDPGTAAEIDRLLDDGNPVYVMGGEAAIGAAVTDELAQRYDVVRVAGETRLETAVAAAGEVGIGERVLIARAFGPGGAGSEGDVTTGWVDAISCGAFAAAAGIPLLLTQTETLSTSTGAALEGSAATSATICGGEAAVSDTVAAELEALGLVVDRVEGVTRVETAIDAAQDLFGLATARGNSYVVAPGYGESFGYGLAAAPLGLPILLVGTTEPTDCADPSQPSRETLCYLQTGEGTAELLVVGGDGVIGADVVEAVATAAGGMPVEAVAPLDAPTGVTAVDDVDDDGTRLTVAWEAVEDPEGILAGYIVTVDGEAGQMVDADTTEVVVDGLTPDEQVSVTVIAVDDADRESDPSEPATATPTDEVPDPIPGLEAVPLDRSVRLVWDEGALDAASYTISRAPAGEGDTCEGVAYAEVTTITDPATLTYTDSGLTNGTAYCYRHVVEDAAGQTSDPAEEGPVTPAEPELAIRILDIDDEFVFHTGYPHVIQTMTTLDQGTTFAQLDLVIEFIPDPPAIGSGDPTLEPIIIRDGEHPATGDVETIFRLLETQTIGAHPATAYDDRQGTLRAAVFAPGGASTDAQVDDVAIDRAPERIMGLKAVGGNSVVALAWDPSPEPTTTEYQVQRATVPVTSQNDDPSVCSSPGLQYSEIARRPVTEPLYTDTAVDNGNALADNRYCYRVRAIRPPAQGLDSSDQQGQFSLVDSANPDITQADLTIDDPQAGTIRERQEYTVRWTITVPQGGQPTESTTLEYCVDYGPNAVGQDTCRSGWTAMTLASSANPAPSVVTAGQTRTFTARWNVPNIDQQTGQTGAVRFTTQGGRDINSGITFR